MNNLHTGYKQEFVNKKDVSAAIMNAEAHQICQEIIRLNPQPNVNKQESATL